MRMSMRNLTLGALLGLLLATAGAGPAHAAVGEVDAGAGSQLHRIADAARRDIPGCLPPVVPEWSPLGPVDLLHDRVIDLLVYACPVVVEALAVEMIGDGAGVRRGNQSATR